MVRANGITAGRWAPTTVGRAVNQPDFPTFWCYNRRA
jgi:hypothetical protein